MRRTIVPEGRFRSDELAPGVFHESFYPGGKEGPNREVHLPTPGGQTWSEAVVLGSADDPFQTLVPDIRLPANQYWPLHWHDCWTVVLVLEGGCSIGDWWFGEGDVFLTVPELEYGPLLIGPEGCRMWEIFAQAHLAPGGYSPEYRDHPTLQNSNHVFRERSLLNRRNDGRQSLPCDGVEGIWKLRLEPGLVIDMGEAGDPERSVLRDTRLRRAPPRSRRLPPRRAGRRERRPYGWFRRRAADRDRPHGEGAAGAKLSVPDQVEVVHPHHRSRVRGRPRLGRIEPRHRHGP
jgi:hypothetical protein